MHYKTMAGEREKRSKKTTMRQYEIMLNYMEKHRNLFSGKLHSNFTSMDRQREWTELAEILNRESGGPRKNVQKWKKTWFDWKSQTKLKSIKLRQNRKQAGNGPLFEEELSHLEEKLISLTRKVWTDSAESDLISRDFQEVPFITPDPILDHMDIECENSSRLTLENNISLISENTLHLSESKILSPPISETRINLKKENTEETISYEVQNSNHISHTDEYDIYGQYVGNEMRKIKDPVAERYVKLKIQELLFNAQAGTLAVSANSLASLHSTNSL